MNDSMKLSKDQKLITLTEEKYREMENEIAEAKRGQIYVRMVMWESRYDHYRLDVDRNYRFYFEAGDKAEEALGEFWKMVSEKITEAQKNNDDTLYHRKQIENSIDQKKDEFNKLIEDQKFVPKWIVRLFGRDNKHRMMV